MANITNQNPLVLDTTGTIFAASIPVRIAAIKAVGLTTAGHVAALQDANSLPIWEDTAPTTNYSSTLEDLCSLPPHRRTYQGLKLATLGSGKVYVWLE